MHSTARPLLLVALALAFTAPADAAPDMVIVNAEVFTADPAQPRAEALAIEKGRFTAVGSSEQVRALAGPDTRVVDAGGRLVTPGLIEAHVHLGWGLPSAPLALPDLPFPGPTAEQVLSAVAQAVEQHAKAAPDAWVSAWIGPRVARDPRNWRTALDAVAPDTPVLLRGFWGHTTLVNSAALRRIGVSDAVRDPIGGWWGRDAQGRLDGRASEAAETVEQQALPPDAARLAPEFTQAAARYAQWGVTSIHLMNSGLSLGQAVDALTLARTPQKWTIYSWAGAVQQIGDAWQAIAAAPTTLPARVRIDGPKWVLDGTGVEQNAHRHDDYPGRPGWKGRSNYSDAQLREILANVLRSPGQAALHVVGDAETQRVLSTMASLAPPEAWRARRVRIEHGDGLRDNTVAQAARLGVVVIQNPTHLPPPLPPGAPARPPGSMAMLNSLRLAGVPLALGSDGGPDEANPFLNIMLASSYAASPGEALPREEALRAYTAGAAFAERQESIKGRIQPGLAADLAVLSQNILTAPLRSLPATTSLLTLVDGQVVHQDATFQFK